MKNKKMPFKNRLLTYCALASVGITGLWQLRQASRNAQKAQEKVLRSFLEESKTTVYGKSHYFQDILGAGSPRELFRLYRKYVPINDYEDLRPFVERHKSGEKDVLFPGKPLMYGTTSGTAREPKWIPITERYYEEVYRKMNHMWFFTLLLNKFRIFDGKALSIVGKAVDGSSQDGTLYGSVSGISLRDIPGFMDIFHTAPAEIFQIADYRARYYAIMRMAIEQNITLIITANPSTLVEMQNNVHEFYDEYADDIEQGSLSRRFDIPGEIRGVLEKCLSPNPERAAELRALKKRFGLVLPKHYWPDLQMINVCMCGNTYVYLKKVRDAFPEKMNFHEFGYFSTECRAGLVLKSDVLDTVSFGHKIYFEFIHESELESPNPSVYQLWEVQPGERYCPVITNSAGLYRYNMNDLLEITGFYGQFPLFTFIQKVNGMVSMRGEKLHERQFIEAVQTAKDELELPLSFFVGFADLEKSQYQFYYEFEDENVPAAKAEKLTEMVDRLLKNYNTEYEYKRESNRVKMPGTSLLVKNSFERFKSACIEKGYRDGQFKLNLLMQDEKRRAMFNTLVK